MEQLGAGVMEHLCVQIHQLLIVSSSTMVHGLFTMVILKPRSLITILHSLLASFVKNSVWKKTSPLVLTKLQSICQRRTLTKLGMYTGYPNKIVRRLIKYEEILRIKIKWIKWIKWIK